MTLSPSGKIPFPVFYHLFSTSILFFLLGCTPEYKPHHAVGKHTEVIVISEPQIYSEVESLLVETLERVIYTPTTERIFDITHITPSEFTDFLYRKNCLIIGLIGDALIDSILSPSSKQKLMRGAEYLFGSTDLFASGQCVLVVAGPTVYKLKDIIMANLELIFNYFSESVRRRLKEELYKDGFQEALSQNLRSRYGFSISVPAGWKVANDEFGFVAFRRNQPDRIISIYWEARPHIELDKAVAIRIRDKIGAKYYDGDYVEDGLTKFYWVNFHNIITGKLDGIWQNDENVTGGPFRTYFFWHGGRFYVIDFHVFAPGEKKWMWLQQLELIADTFSP